ncbi:Lysophospholipase L1 [Lentzea albidocapillata subsp. violacea]|uniref:Lysophospholipase L1 n=1 Tax=Lentzea albidocapillata subsp. violacea TaxID=128104 RepID=A0A1G9VAS8_9PSEU|nr:SGNH/GDSL hydrolase family protein [Lentzea albidocapillata]SDM69304.1 Lysophospholipase L1 [Lentzea albidocapillata subsp. violacea]
MGLLAGVLAVALLAPAPIAPEYVALGDSYASGAGAGSYVDGSCRRSSNAYPALRGTEFPSFKFVACSGATTKSLRSQFRALTANTTFVTITIGGNDLGFVDVLTTCTLSGDRACAKRVATAVDFIHGQLPARLDTAYATIKEAAPHAKLVVLGYPRLFTPNDGCRTLSKSKRQVLNEAADQLSGVIAQAAGRAGARYVDVREAFADHGVCAAEPWMNALVNPTADSYHPNKAGQAAYFRALTS